MRGASRSGQTAERWSRRAVLSRLGAGAALAPFVPLLSGDAEAQPARFPKRFIVMFYPSGTVAASYFPRNGTETSFALSPILEPLEPHKGDLLILEGIDVPAAVDGIKWGHISYMGTMLTGIPIQNGSFVEETITYGWAGGPSVDQVVAREIGKETAFPSLEFHAVGNVDQYKTQFRMCYRGPGEPVTGERDPRVMQDRIFAKGAVGGAELRRIRSERKSVLDYLKGDVARLQQRVGAADRARLDGHVTAIREIEARLARGAVSCAVAPVDIRITRPDGSANYRAVGKAHMDLIVRALTCDATRVASLQWGAAGRGATMTWLGHTIDEHGLSHAGPSETDKIRQLAEVKRFYMEQLAYLVTELKKVPDGTGTLFDSTLILACSEHGNGAVHDNKSVPFLLAGSARGVFKTGRHLKYRSAPNNKLLVSIGQAMGLSADSFGSSKYGTGALEGLRA